MAKRKLTNMKRSLEAQKEDIIIDVSTQGGRDNYKRFVLDPIKAKMEAEIAILASDPKNTIPSTTEVDYDFHTIASNYFSKTDVKTLQIDQKNNKLYLTHKVQGFSKNRGFTGILHELDPTQHSIFLANSSGIDSDGNVIRNVHGNILNDLNVGLQSGKFEIIDIKDKENIVRGKDSAAIANPVLNAKQASQLASYSIMNLNEGTSLIIRTDASSDLYTKIKSTFRDGTAGDSGGEMNKLFRAVLGDNNGKLTDSNHKNLLNRLQDPKSPKDIVTAVEIVRIMKNNALALHDVIASDGTVDVKKLKHAVSIKKKSS